MARTQRSIQAFTRVSKPLGDGLATSNKRKHVIESRDSSPEPAMNHKKQRLQLEILPETPTKSLKRAIANLSLSAIPAPALKAAKRKRAPTPDVETPPTSPDATQFEETKDVDEVPIELEDLMNLNSAFLTALSLHYAHHGSLSPVDVRMLTPSVTKAWGKRKTTIEDIRLCLGVTYSKSTKRNTFVLSNYGNGRICIELAGKKQRKGLMYQGFSEKEMRAQFDDSLERAWSKWSKKEDTEVFIQSLPLADVTMCESVAKLAPMLEKGQQRVDHVLGAKSERGQKRRKVVRFEEPMPIKQEEEAEEAMPIDPPAQPKQPAKPLATTRALDLLSRIQAKEHAISLLPAGPTKAQQEQTRALQRVEEIMSILDLLAAGKGGGSRVSFPFPLLIQSVQASLRSPMSKEEIEKVFEVMGGMVAVGFVRVVAFGGVRAVVVNRGCKPGQEVLRERLRELGC